MWALLFVILGLLSWYFAQNMKKRSTFWRYLEAMPGPKRYPFVGSIEMLRHKSQEKTFYYHRDLNRRYPEIYSYMIFHVSFVGLSSPEDVEIIMSSMSHISKSYIYGLLLPWLGTGLLTSTGDKWQKRRKILTPAFHFSILQEFIGIFNKETDHLVNVLENKCNEEDIDVMKPVLEFTLSSIGETSLGVIFNEFLGCNGYRQAIHDYIVQKNYQMMRPWLYPTWIFAQTEYGRANVKAVETLHAFSKSVIRERRQSFVEQLSYSTRKRLAMLDLLLKAKMDGADIDDEGIREEVDTFMFEGHDTVAMAICYALVVLANQPKIQAEVLQEITDVLGNDGKAPNFNDLAQLGFTERCIKEVLRLFPSVPFVAREAGESFITKDGYTVPEGCDVHIYIYDLHRNPRIWNNPEKFDPDRFLPDNVAERHPFAYIPFSAGPRNCIGQRYAILEIKAVLCGILRRFKLEPVTKPDEIRFKADLVLRPTGELRVKFVHRSCK